MESSELLQFSLADVVVLQVWPREPAEPVKHCALLPVAQATRERQIRDAEAESKGGGTVVFAVEKIGGRKISLSL